MTLRKLSQLYYLKREIEHDEARLAELRSVKYSPGRSNTTDIPGGGYKSALEQKEIAIDALIKTIEEKKARCVLERRELEHYIAGIPDSLTRQIFTLRFVEGLSWQRVAFGVGGGNTADSVRMICQRHIKQNN